MIESKPKGREINLASDYRTSKFDTVFIHENGFKKIKSKHNTS